MGHGRDGCKYLGTGDHVTYTLPLIALNPSFPKKASAWLFYYYYCMWPILNRAHEKFVRTGTRSDPRLCAQGGGRCECEATVNGSYARSLVHKADLLKPEN